MKLMTINQYREQQFVEGSRPTLATLRKWIDNETIDGRVIGKKYYVEIQEQAPVNDLVTKALVA